MLTFELRLVVLVALVAGVAAAAAAGGDVFSAVLFAGALAGAVLIAVAVAPRPVPPHEADGEVAGPAEGPTAEGTGGGPGPLRATAAAVPRHSVWPVAAAASAVVLAAGLVYEPRVAALAVAAVALAGLGWTLQVRVLPGLAGAGIHPATAGAAALAFVGVLAWVPARTAAAIAVAAVVCGLVAAFVVARPGTSPARGTAVVVAALAAAVVLGAMVSAAGDRQVSGRSVAAGMALVAAGGLVVAAFVLAGRATISAAGVAAALVAVGLASGALGTLGAALSSPSRPGGKVAGPAPRPAVSGKAVYAANCASCHGSRGEGGVGPKLAGGEARLTFPNEADHITWVKNGSVAVKGRRYGDPNRPGGQRGPATGAMPGFGAQLTDEQIAAVVAYERNEL